MTSSSKAELSVVNDGLTPFPAAERWVGQLAHMAWGAIHRLANVSPDCSPLVQQIMDGLNVLPADAWIHRLASPAAFAWATETQKKGVVTEEDWKLLQTELAHDPGGVAVAYGSPVHVWRKPSAKMLERMRHAGAGSLGTDSLSANFLDPNGEFFADCVERIRVAMDLVRSVAPGFYADVNAFLHGLALVDNKASFRGSSSLGRFGLVWFSPRATWLPQIWAEEIVHEGTHNLIDAVGARHGLLLGDNLEEAKFPSPLRNDPRPIGGVFHALVVVSRVLVLLDRLEEAGKGYPALAERREILLSRGRESLATFEAAAHPSPLGEVFLDGIVRPALAV